MWSNLSKKMKHWNNFFPLNYSEIKKSFSQNKINNSSQSLNVLFLKSHWPSMSYTEILSIILQFFRDLSKLSHVLIYFSIGKIHFCLISRCTDANGFSHTSPWVLKTPGLSPFLHRTRCDPRLMFSIWAQSKMTFQSKFYLEIIHGLGCINCLSCFQKVITKYKFLDTIKALILFCLDFYWPFLNPLCFGWT